MATQPAAKLGLGSGVGLVVADMIGAGVLTSIGFMVAFNGLGPSHVMLAWLVGGALAMLGAVTYGAAARLMPTSGGEYRYLSELWHPSIGTFAGWSSLFAGFAPPLAGDALAIGAFAKAMGAGADVHVVFPMTVLGHHLTGLQQGLDPRLLGTILIVGVTLMHAIGLRASKTAQNVLVGLKIVLVLGFVGVGLVLGKHDWPTWQPAGGAAFPTGGFVVALFFIAFAYSGWNAAIYAADQFANPRRDVRRAMLIGCGLVLALYLVLNWVFITNLSPGDLTAWAIGDTKTITVGHVLMQHFVGDTGAKVMSLFMIVALTSAASAMTMIGPRVYAAMARDGYLPRVFAGKDDKPPIGALLLQSGLAIIVLWTASFREILENVGIILTLNAALVAAGLLFRRKKVAALGGIGVGAQVAAALLVGAAGLLFYAGVKAPPPFTIGAKTYEWIGIIVAFSAAAYVVGARTKRAAA